MAQSSVLELAKQGDSEAIATLINRSIQSKGITATASLDQECLNIDLRSPQKINQKAMVSLLRKGMLNLEVENIKELAITAYQSDYETASDRQVWEIKINLESAELIQPLELIPKSPEIIPDPSVSSLVVPKTVQIKHLPQSYQDIIIRFTDPLYGSTKCLCTLTELVQVINNFSFGNANPALKNLLEAIAESTVIDDNGDRIINNISVLQPGSQWQRAKIRLVVNIFFESEGYVPPSEPNVEALTGVITLEAIETPASNISEDNVPEEKRIPEEKIEPAKTPKQILLEDLSSLLTDMEKSQPTESSEPQKSDPDNNDVLTLDELSKVW